MTNTWKLSGLVVFGRVMTKIAKDPIHVGGAYKMD